MTDTARAARVTLRGLLTLRPFRRVSSGPVEALRPVAATGPAQAARASWKRVRVPESARPQMDRPCGCPFDPIVFGHTGSGLTVSGNTDCAANIGPAPL
jgi:hypothetical protein